MSTCALCPACCQTHCVPEDLALVEVTGARAYISSGHLFGEDISPNTFSAGLEVSVRDVSTTPHQDVRTDSHTCDWACEVELWSPRAFHGDSASLPGAPTPGPGSGAMKASLFSGGNCPPTPWCALAGPAIILHRYPTAQ